MTTIVYRDGVIAVDSRSTAGGTITNDGRDKSRIENGVLFVTCGTAGDQDEIINAYNGDKFDNTAEIGALISDKGKVYVAGINKDDGFWKLDITDQYYSIGSGSDHAWTALDLGCTAAEAVKMAIKPIWASGRILHNPARKLCMNLLKLFWWMVLPILYTGLTGIYGQAGFMTALSLLQGRVLGCRTKLSRGALELQQAPAI